VRSAARNRISLMTFGQASASTQILGAATFHPRETHMHRLNNIQVRLPRHAQTDSGLKEVAR
jgi:hypothetical protein